MIQKRQNQIRIHFWKLEKMRIRTIYKKSGTPSTMERHSVSQVRVEQPLKWFTVTRLLTKEEDQGRPASCVTDLTEAQEEPQPLHQPPLQPQPHLEPWCPALYKHHQVHQLLLFRVCLDSNPETPVSQLVIEHSHTASRFHFLPLSNFLRHLKLLWLLHQQLLLL
jgi:hypothetical protein